MKLRLTAPAEQFLVYGGGRGGQSQTGQDGRVRASDHRWEPEHAMTRSAAPPAQAGPNAPEPGIPLRAPLRLRVQVAGLLTTRIGGDPDAGRRILEAGERLGYDMSVLWTSLDRGGNPATACLVAPGAGRLGVVYIGHKPGDEPLAALPSVIRCACDDAARRCRLRVVQALLERNSEDVALAGAFEGAGFTRLADLLFLRRLRRSGDADGAPALPERVVVEQWRPNLDSDFAEALERSYEDTLDCPELCGLRETADALASHRSAGRFEPALWWLIRADDGAPAGVMLLNASALGDSAELVYIGLAPQLRGRGLGSALLRMGLAEAAQRGLDSIACAVDSRNAPARALYERLGFVEFARRTPFVRALAHGGSTDAPPR